MPGTSLVVPSGCRSRAWHALAAGAEAVGLGFAPALGDGFGQGAEEDGEPQPGGDGDAEHRRPVHGDRGAQGGADQHGEHDRGMDHLPRGELPDRERQGGGDGRERQFGRGLGVVLVLAGVPSGLPSA